MTAPAVVSELVERFTGHRDEYRSGRYNETQLRRDFLDPLFAALGWDVHNKQGYAEAYREVIQRQIDRLVYELYDLTDEEIAIVEEATG